MSEQATPARRPRAPEQKGKLLDLDKAQKLILLLPSVMGVGFNTTESGELDGIRAIIDGSIPTKEVVRSIEAVMLVDMNYNIDYRRIFAVVRHEKARSV